MTMFNALEITRCTAELGIPLFNTFLSVPVSLLSKNRLQTGINASN